MSLETKEDGDKVHYPKRRDVFEFDAEVAAHFDSMAVRSIPMYAEVHRLHTSLLRPYLQPGTVIVDIGSSTGMTFRAIEKELGKPLKDTGMCAYAIDSSSAMNIRMALQFPSVLCYTKDIADMFTLPLRADIVFAYYVLQFLPTEKRGRALSWIASNLKEGGILVLGQKDNTSGEPFDSSMGEEYYKFRRDNGYTQAEIDAKTAALRNSMWPVLNDTLRAELRLHGFDFVETSRWLQFSTMLAVKRG